MRDVGQFFVQSLIELLARQLSGQHAHRHVRDLIFRIEPGARLHGLAQSIDENVNALACDRREREGFVERELLVDRCDQGQKVGLIHLVDLIEHQPFGLTDAL